MRRGCPRAAGGPAGRRTLRRGRRLREPWDEGAGLALVAAEGVAAAAQRGFPRRRDAGGEEDGVEGEAGGEGGEHAPWRRDGDEPVGEPGQCLEEVIRVARDAPEP